MILMLPVSGCVSAVSGTGVCEATAPATTAHAAALASDGGPASLVTGQRLIVRLDAACGR
jgi:hypothetical protein